MIGGAQLSLSAQSRYVKAPRRVVCCCPTIKGSGIHSIVLADHDKPDSSLIFTERKDAGLKCTKMIKVKTNIGKLRKTHEVRLSCGCCILAALAAPGPAKGGEQFGSVSRQQVSGCESWEADLL